MKTDSPLFDSIRVKPDKDRRPRNALPGCEWPRCEAAATHRAPKGRLRENEHWRFCLGHVREYNHSYNFFAGMSDDAIAKYQKDAVTGHRPALSPVVAPYRSVPNAANRKSQRTLLT